MCVCVQGREAEDEDEVGRQGERGCVGQRGGQGWGCVGVCVAGVRRERQERDCRVPREKPKQ